MRRGQKSKKAGVKSTGGRIWKWALGWKPAVSSSRKNIAPTLESLEARWLMSVAPLVDPDEGQVKLPGLDASNYVAPLGFDYVVPLGFDAEAPDLKTDSLNLGFDTDTSDYFKDTGADPLGDGTPTGSSYMLHQAWGGMWVDAEKTPSDTEDDLHCWAAATSNVLAWTGWGLVGGMTNTDQMFQYFQDHWTDQGGLMEFGWDWWFDGTNDSQGWSGWAQEDVQGGGFYPSVNFASVFRSQSNESAAMAAINSYLHDGYGTTIGIYGPGGHAITVWGYNYNPSNPSDYYGIWVTDSDDTKYQENAPDRLRYYEVDYISGRWYLQDYYGSDSWYIGVVQGLAQKNPGEPVAPAPNNQIRGTVYSDVNHDGDKDTGESVLAGKTVFLDTNENGVIDSETVTAASTDVPVDIVDLMTVTSTLTISDTSLPISDVNVTLDITHSYTSDLEVFLISPDGTRVQLFSEVGGSGNNFTNTTLDDQAATSITSASAPFTGTFRPQGLLSDFNGESANGVWTLEITDYWSWDSGTLNSWSLDVTTGEAQTTTQANGSYAFSGLEDGDYRVQLVMPDGWSNINPAVNYYDVTVAGNTVAANRNFGITNTVMNDLGTVDLLQMENVAIEAGTTWYHCKASHTGFVTIETTLDAPGDVLVRLYNANVNVVATSVLTSGSQRLNYRATAGSDYYVEVIALSPQTLTSLRVTNLVNQSGTTVTVYGTAGDDDFVFATGSQHLVQINGVAYAFSTTAVKSIVFGGGVGDDTATLTGSARAETFTLAPGTATITGGGYTLLASSVSTVVASGGGGADIARLYGSTGDDALVASPTVSQLSGAGFSNEARAFRYVYAYAYGGVDTAEFHDSAGNDTFVGTKAVSHLAGVGFHNQAQGFDTVYAHSTAGGADTAKLYDSSGNDTFVGGPTESHLSGVGFHNEAQGFRYVYAYATSGGVDTAELHDSAANDTFGSTPTVAYMIGGGAYNRVQAFDAVRAYSTAGGEDTAKMYGSARSDRFNGYETYAEMFGTGYFDQANGFRYVYAYGSGGTDFAYLYDSAGDDTFVSTPTISRLYGDNFFNQVQGFRYVYAYATAGGVDTADLHGSTGNDAFYGYQTYAILHGAAYYSRAAGFDRVNAHAVWGGTDVARLYGSTGDDTLVSRPAVTSLSSDGFHNEAQGFRYVYAYATAGGVDTAEFHDSAGNDTFVATPVAAYLSGVGFYNRAQGFQTVRAHSTAGGADIARLYDSAGDDTFVSQPTLSYLAGNGFHNEVESFRYVYAYANAGGADVAELYDSAGNDTLVTYPTYAYLTGAGFYNRAEKFRTVHGHSTAGGDDRANMYGSSANDTFNAYETYAELFGNGFYDRANGFRYVYAYGVGGADVANLYDSTGDDTFAASPTAGYLTGTNFYNYAQGFRYLYAHATAGGMDTADLYDSAAVDQFHGYETHSILQGATYFRRANGFERVNAHSRNGGKDVAYLYAATSDDLLEAGLGFAQLNYAGGSVSALDFSWVRATASEGGANQKTVGAVDFVLQTQGEWTDV